MFKKRKKTPSFFTFLKTTHKTTTKFKKTMHEKVSTMQTLSKSCVPYDLLRLTIQDFGVYHLEKIVLKKSLSPWNFFLKLNKKMSHLFNSYPKVHHLRKSDEELKNYEQKNMTKV